MVVAGVWASADAIPAKVTSAEDKTQRNRLRVGSDIVRRMQGKSPHLYSLAYALLCRLAYDVTGLLHSEFRWNQVFVFPTL